MSSDWKLLEEIKRRIEEISGLGAVEEWTQKDYEFLSFFIEERTACRLSVSTLKRIWANQHHRMPHIATLNALSKLSFDQDWQTLKSKRLTTQMVKKEPPSKQPTASSKTLKKVGLLTLALLILLLLITMNKKEEAVTPEVHKEVSFSYKKTMELTVPNTVVFTYDLEGIEADRFFLQQSWDTSRKVEIAKGSTERTDIYYVPGYFTAKLIADEQIIGETPIHITSKDWFIAARQPMSNIVTFDPELWLEADFLGLDPKTLEAKGINLGKEFQLSFYYVKDFGLDGDNLTHTTAFKMEALEVVDCPIISVHIQGVDGFYWIMVGNKGCESELHLWTGETIHNGKTEDLTMLGVNTYEWNELKIKTINKEVVLELNGENVFSTSYTESIGKVMEISYFLNGPGVIDNVSLHNTAGEAVFSDDFTQGTE